MNSLVFRPNRVAREIDNIFGDFFRFPVSRTDNDADFMPRVNIEESKDNVALTFELPGMAKDDVKVSIKDNILTVCGERKLTNEEKDKTYVRTEIRTGSFCRSFTLPDTVNVDNIGADYKNGMLEIKMPKLEEVKPKEIEINVE